jgi:DNA-binding PadR family transcriptional regulator
MISREITKGSFKFLILYILSEGEYYGYSLAQRIREISDQEMIVSEGSLYPALYNLESEGYIKSRWDMDSTPKRKYYSITRQGKIYLNEQKNDFAKFNNLLNKILS